MSDMSDGLLLFVGFIIGAALCVIHEIASAYRSGRKTWLAPIGTNGEETVYQCRKCGATFSCAAIERMLYCPICGRKVVDE
jgi:DNA-directed RNA polymerase subunit RPC12/RpoP